MKVLVTGGAGFIGSHTVDLLINEGHEVTILDKFEEQVHQGKTPDYINPKANLIKGDLGNIKVIENALKGVDSILHLAALVGVGQSMYKPLKYLEANTVGTANLFNILINNKEIRNNIKKIVVASSKSIYGEGAYECKTHGIIYPGLRPRFQLEKKDWEIHCTECKEHAKPIAVTEEKPVQNLSIYALSKYDTERIAIMYGHTFQIHTIAFRYFNVYGPRQSLNNPYTGVAAILMSRIKNNNPPVVYEDGHQIRDFIFVEDIARANVAAIETDKFVISPLNVGTGKT